MACPVLKVSVLASGAVLLDGQPVSLEELQAQLENAKPERPVVWYFREAAGGEPPAEAMQVMKMVVDNRLPISLSSKPDFSDYVDMKGRAHPRYATWEAAVAVVREKTAGGKYAGLIRPDRSYMLVASPAKSSVPAQMIQMMEKMIPPKAPRNVAVIADTYFTWKIGGGIPSVEEIGREIPFFGMLLGMACIGHSVCLFPGTDESLVAGCKGADVLIVDERQIPALAVNWKEAAGRTMRSPNILIHEKAGFRLAPA